jgi:hypothetical protein
MKIRSARARALFCGVALALAATAMACAPPPDPAGSLGLRAVLGDGEVVLTWNDPGGLGVDLQVLRPGGSWEPLPKPSGGSATFVPEQPRERYNFRIRPSVAPGSQPNTWDRSVSILFVVPVLPVVRIDTDGNVPIVDKETRLPGDISIDPNGSSFAPYSGRLEINGRGNSTWTQAKKPWRIRLASASPIMGMPSNRHWVMLANALDPSQLRTWVAMELSEATDLAWTPRFRHVELILNGQYHGVYQLGEHVRRDTNRVNIANLQPTHLTEPNLTGGYLLEVDRRITETGAPGFITPRNVPVVVDTPDPAMPEQMSYIRNYVNAFEAALFSPGFTDPVNGYRQYFDVDSFVDWHLVEEVMKNDTFFSSGWFSKNRNDVIRFGPVWDFDQTMGNVQATDQTPIGWHSRERGAWTRRLFQDPGFVARYAERFEQFKAAFAEIPQRAEDLGEALAPAIRNDEARWFYSLDERHQPAFIRSWLEQRLAWIDANL